MTDRLAPDLPTRVRQAVTVGFDIGGTKVLAGVLDTDGHVLAKERRDTPGHSAAAVEDTIASMVDAFARKHAVAAVGVGAAGFVDADRSRVVFAPHLAWRDEPLREALATRLDLPVVIDNDANLAALAEARSGAAVGHRYVLLVTLGTGIGGALVVDGEIHRGATGMAGEFGHMQVVPDGLRCPCGNRGCWEQYASGTALAREARDLLHGDSLTAHALRERSGGDLSAVTGSLVTQLAREGDALSVDLVQDMGRWLGTGLANLTAAFDPGCIVVGGGVSEAGELLLEPVRTAFAGQLVGRGHREPPVVVAARLGPDAGFVGAAHLARSVIPA